ncbi:hypothetical protein [Tunicatimonas pelagia]|uniref:hypothetical protein n=1 Tax=Tunicatimonas pelagia TaxID=931531 RepID=UPI002666B786|nr:hypothetical protein [Tunicatimonas pelagia]WKN43963.1 hypothetical protein P0M28_03125 [Tunicatimonas pelagia]
MQIKYTPHYLRKLEELLNESGYVLRYEKGSFKSGYCILRDTCLVIVNKYYTLEGKINCLLEIVRQLDIDPEKLSPKQRKLLVDLLEIPNPL